MTCMGRSTLQGPPNSGSTMIYGLSLTCKDMHGCEWAYLSCKGLQTLDQQGYMAYPWHARTCNIFPSLELLAMIWYGPLVTFMACKYDIWLFPNSHVVAIDCTTYNNDDTVHSILQVAAYSNTALSILNAVIIKSTTNSTSISNKEYG